MVHCGKKRKGFLKEKENTGIVLNAASTEKNKYLKQQQGMECFSLWKHTQTPRYDHYTIIYAGIFRWHILHNLVKGMK